jgi:hypothetical protein
LDYVNLYRRGEDTLETDNTFIADEIILSNTVWGDIQVPLTQGKQGVIDKPAFDYDYVAYKFIKDSTEIVVGSAEIPHNWKIGTNLHPHVHLLQTSAADTAQFTLQWKWQSLGEAADATWKYTTLSSREFTYVSGDIMQLVEGLPMDGSAQTLSSVILYKLKRKNAGGLTNSYVYNVGFHYEIDALGSKDELVK